MNYEDVRLEALCGYRVLDTEPHPAFDNMTRAASLALDMPIALVSLVDCERQWFKSFVGLSLRETSRNASFCAHAIEHDQPFIIPDATKDDRFAENPLVLDEPHIRFYAGIPLIDPEGFALGTLCVIDREPRELEPKQIEILKALAGGVMTALMAHKQGALLTRAERLLAQDDRQCA